VHRRAAPGGVFALSSEPDIGERLSASAREPNPAPPAHFALDLGPGLKPGPSAVSILYWQRREAIGRLSDDLRALIGRCLHRDQAAMLELVRRFEGQVYGLCYRMLGQRQDAEDAAQETFVRVLRNLGRWDQDRDFEPWLFAIAGNRCRTALANRLKRSGMRTIVDGALADQRDDSPQSSGLAEEVQLALSQLRAEYRQAFVLFHYQERSYAEIALALDCPVGTVKTWIHRARLDMMQFLRGRGIGLETRHAVRQV
jgi:RNA polymerase sigma-70 factor (ECF subfamily)